MRTLDQVSAGGGPAAPILTENLRERLTSVETWIFDLDNTLYPPGAKLFDQIESRMTEFVARTLWLDEAEARRVSEEYWKAHGATLTGLMARNGLSSEPFLAFTHDIDVSALTASVSLREALISLPGRKVVYTNGPRRHAQRVTDQLGFRDLFDAFYAIEDARFTPKPTPDGFARIVRMDGMDPTRAAMIEDDVRNLQTPKDMGMTTIWLTHGRIVPPAPDYVDIVAEDLEHFLSQL